MDFLNTPEKLNRRLVHNPMGRFGEAVEQAKAVVFCMSLNSVRDLDPQGRSKGVLGKRAGDVSRESRRF
jgi:hypothetical protein